MNLVLKYLTIVLVIKNTTKIAKVIQMSENFKRPRRHKATLKPNFIFPIVCLLFLGAAMWTNSIATNYISKITDLTNKIKSVTNESTEIESKNQNIKDSIAELDTLIEKLETELN